MSLWLMYKSWKQGIPTHIHKNQELRDVNVMVEIDEAMIEKTKREKSIQDMMNQMGRL